jgi:hypothetical protein
MDIDTTKNKCEIYEKLLINLNQYKDGKFIKDYYMVFHDDVKECNNMKEIFNKNHKNLFIWCGQNTVNN